MSAIFKGDDTGAFGNQFITIKVNNPLLYPISKIEFVTNGGVCIPNKPFLGSDYDNFQIEEITLTVNYSSEETKKLNATNTGNLVVYDMNGKQSTCQQSLTFYAKNGVISKNGQQCKC